MIFFFFWKNSQSKQTTFVELETRIFLFIYWPCDILSTQRRCFFHCQEWYYHITCVITVMILSDCKRSYFLSILNTNLHTRQLCCFITTRRPLFHGVLILISWYCLKFTYLDRPWNICRVPFGVVNLPRNVNLISVWTSNNIACLSLCLYT